MKNWLGSFLFQLSTEAMEVRGVLFAIETEEEKNRIQHFHLDHNNAPCLSQRDIKDQESKEKTGKNNKIINRYQSLERIAAHLQMMAG